MDRKASYFEGLQLSSTFNSPKEEIRNECNTPVYNGTGLIKLDASTAAFLSQEFNQQKLKASKNKHRLLLNVDVSSPFGQRVFPFLTESRKTSLPRFDIYCAADTKRQTRKNGDLLQPLNVAKHRVHRCSPKGFTHTYCFTRKELKQKVKLFDNYIKILRKSKRYCVSLKKLDQCPLCKTKIGTSKTHSCKSTEQKQNMITNKTDSTSIFRESSDVLLPISSNVKVVIEPLCKKLSQQKLCKDKDGNMALQSMSIIDYVFGDSVKRESVDFMNAVIL